MWVHSYDWLLPWSQTLFSVTLVMAFIMETVVFVRFKQRPKKYEDLNISHNSRDKYNKQDIVPFSLQVFEIQYATADEIRKRNNSEPVWTMFSMVLENCHLLL
jgi:hypothetical protein